MHRFCSYFVSAPKFCAQVPRYMRYIIAVGLFLCRGCAQVMQRARFFCKCGCLCDKTLFLSYLFTPNFYAQAPIDIIALECGRLCDTTLLLSYLLAPNFYAQVPRYIVTQDFFAEVMHRLCRGVVFPLNVVVYAIKRGSFLTSLSQIFMHSCRAANAIFSQWSFSYAAVGHRSCTSHPKVTFFYPHVAGFAAKPLFCQ